MKEFKYSNLTMEVLNKVFKEIQEQACKRTYTMYANGKFVKEIYPHLENIDENCTYLIEMPFSDFKQSIKKEKHGRKRKRSRRN